MPSPSENRSCAGRGFSIPKVSLRLVTHKQESTNFWEGAGRESDEARPGRGAGGIPPKCD